MSVLPVLVVAVLLILVVTAPSYGQLSDRTGIISRLDVDAGGHQFEVTTTANFDVTSAEFDAQDGTLTMYIESGLENNFGQIVIPVMLLAGDIKFALDDGPVTAAVKSNSRILFITVEFLGAGKHTLEITGSKVLGRDRAPQEGGCLIATAAYGTESAMQVQKLRETRTAVKGTPAGAAFLELFNAAYYSFSPHISDMQRQNPALNHAILAGITPALHILGVMSYADGELETVLYGMLAMALLLSAYVLAPAVLIRRAAGSVAARARSA